MKDGNEVTLHENEVTLHGNEVTLHENEVTLHENEVTIPPLPPIQSFQYGIMNLLLPW